ncbi:hypothetical protein PAL_GLEAN10025253 [Pteropus alecto]|uniref:Uncharacterized protein n=1 Tax=Pteropus alecto TaxID=9402 RepID=L5JMI9_PTEAL|nr:hypothetical protein PAL_GLEAN10025253 [Pteropus alecto]
MDVRPWRAGQGRSEPRAGSLSSGCVDAPVEEPYDGTVWCCRAGPERRRTSRIFFTEPCLGKKQALTPLPGALLPGEARQCLRLRKGGRQRSRIEEVGVAVEVAEAAPGGTPPASSSLWPMVPGNRRSALD